MKYKSIEEWEDFKNTSAKCVCGRLMTGFHMMNCNALKKREETVLEILNHNKAEKLVTGVIPNEKI